jgi:hypothetical protein
MRAPNIPNPNPNPNPNGEILQNSKDYKLHQAHAFFWSPKRAFSQSSELDVLTEGHITKHIM